MTWDESITRLSIFGDTFFFVKNKHISFSTLSFCVETFHSNQYQIYDGFYLVLQIKNVMNISICDPAQELN